MFWDDKYGTQGLSKDVSIYLITSFEIKIQTLTSKTLTCFNWGQNSNISNARKSKYVLIFQVIAKMRTMMTDDSTNNNTFLLDDDSRLDSQFKTKNFTPTHAK